MTSTSPTALAPPAVSKRGFTLLEILLTVVLLASGLLTLQWVFGRGVFASNDAADLRVATALAQTKMEVLRDTDFASVTTETRAAVTGFAGFEREVTVTASPGSTDANLKQIDVIVYWTLTGGEISTTLTVYRANSS